MVTPDWEGAVPTVTVIGTAPPVGAPAGMIRFTCITPEIRPAALPAYTTFAGNPLTVAVTGSTGFLSELRTGGMIAPSTPGGAVWPSPVIYTLPNEPRAPALLGLLTLTPS